jgi:hypothetical protein
VAARGWGEMDRVMYDTYYVIIIIRTLISRMGMNYFLAELLGKDRFNLARTHYDMQQMYSWVVFGRLQLARPFNAKRRDLTLARAVELLVKQLHLAKDELRVGHCSGSFGIPCYHTIRDLQRHQVLNLSTPCGGNTRPAKE